MIVALKLIIDLSVLKCNLAVLKGMTQAKLCAVVKADLYGHGLGALKAFEDADEFAVSSIGEAKEICKMTVNPINILSLPDKTVNCEYGSGIVPAVATVNDIEFVSRHGATAVNIKVNSGMNRYGVSAEGFAELLRTADKHRLKIKSAFSHIYEISAARKQFSYFMNTVKPFEDFIPQRHILSSNFITLPEFMHLDMVRAGIALYGYGSENLRSAVTARCGVVQIREVTARDNIGYGICESGKPRRLAVLGAGYADGIRRICDNIPHYVEIGGNLCPIVGQVCMDATMVDISGLDVSVGDEATILGSAYGCDAAACAYGTITYEILTGMSSKRVQRVYIEDN